MGDDRLAKWSRVAWDNSMDESPEGVHSIKDALMALADAESADLRAALVVARERLAAVEATLTAIRELHKPCPPRTEQQIRYLKRQGRWAGWQPWCMECSDDSPVTWPCPTAAAVRAALVGRPPTPHPTQEKP